MEQEPNLPVSYPIKTLKDLVEGSYYNSFHFIFNKSSVKLKNSTSTAKRPRLLACHDFKGGYVDDQWIQGSGNGDAYTLINWRLLDIFVYFSHNLVTLPPPGWVNAAHKHGVQVLGTFITEWDEGYKVCQELCATEDSARLYASLLAELAQSLGFDGWLVNIENKVADLVPNLLAFVELLTDAMHAWVPGSTVIWYDSVTIDGHLFWQNRLNELNRPFFDISDAIFTNYHWQEHWARESGDLADGRRFDVYMGVDVFGRGTFGGGGYQCDVALKAAKEAQVSAALFAPGWTYENNEDDERWWRSIYSCWPDARIDPVQLPFYSNFDVGHGQAIYLDGKQVSGLPWSNLSCQNLQPLLRVESSSSKQLAVTLRQDSPVYSGGSSVNMVGRIASDEICLFQLYNTAVSVETTRDETCLNATYSVFAKDSSNFCLAVRTEHHHGAYTIHCLLDTEGQEIDAFESRYELGPATLIFDYSTQPDTDESGSPESTEESDTAESSGKRVHRWRRKQFTLTQEKYILTGVFGVCSTAKDLRPLLIKLLQENGGAFDSKNFPSQGVEETPNAKAEEVEEGEGVKEHAEAEEVEEGEGVKEEAEVEEGESAEEEPQAEEREEGEGAEEDAEAEKIEEVEEEVGEESNSAYHAVLGDISLARTSHNCNFSYPDQRFVANKVTWIEGNGGEKLMSVNLIWRGHPEKTNWERFHLYAKTSNSDDADFSSLQYLGVAVVEAFFVSELKVPEQSKFVKFYLQPQCGCGKLQSLPSCSTHKQSVPPPSSKTWMKPQPTLKDWLFNH
ncbi:hypothetical protein R1sor_005077 [Riccia sorocarpa]|uniref:mannosyl-glycoprotein endo-beta-N-acetylglucosaminidase n=1 Tax=Riccia sorocarpa TaxID=122646 RepID=A0ABD3HKJ1_9MARC